MVGRERRRLARAFRWAMAAAAGPTLMMACDAAKSADDGVDASVGDAGLHDATFPSDVAAPPSEDAGVDAGPNGTAVDAAPPIPPGDATLPDAFAQGGCYTGGVDLDSSFGVEGAPPGQDTCAYFYGCGIPEGLAAIGCTLYNVSNDGAVAPIYGETCWIPDDAGCADGALAPGDGGALTILCNPCFGGGGRRPAGLVSSPAFCGDSALGAYLAALAFEEEASIAAFARMESELSTLGAPSELVTAARRAANDEVLHARVMSRLSRLRGGRTVRARVKRSGRRRTVFMAAENAAEGCVRETFGALLARWQATHAEDPALRRAFAKIARDEARHAALSWAVAEWLERSLDDRDRRRVAAARARAIRALESAFDDPPASLVRDAGLPTADRARVLFASLIRALGLTTGARR